ncbi:MAG: carbohydrate ABC transporter permease [Eubacteriales bacterium]|nr:carbohydrate ABC transporter permease [Eubacteriales bacterium]MDD3880991.1 carbohydrate ABC transporter permease [Eubacteriales bacterium]MDD4511940.1 carbohydrate ABC transporter permease [Eubacteriales bacterium]
MAIGGTKFSPKKFSKNQLPIYLYMVPIAVFMGAPILYIVNNAFKPMDELYAFPPRFFVTNPSLVNFRNLFQTAAGSGIPISRYVFNSLIVTLLVVLLSVLISTMAGFALSKLKFPGKKAIFEVNNAALMFVTVAVTIPRYLTISSVGILDTYLAHILPLIAMPVSLFLIKQFIDQVPNSLLEAAQLEGANSFTVYRKVILPLIKPAVATGAILAFQQVWNNIETSNLFTSAEGMRTLAFYMNTLTGVGTVAGQGMAAAASLIMFVPNLILFIIMQSSVMNTMAYSGMK